MSTPNTKAQLVAGRRGRVIPEFWICPATYPAVDMDKGATRPLVNATPPDPTKFSAFRQLNNPACASQAVIGCAGELVWGEKLEYSTHVRNEVAAGSWDESRSGEITSTRYGREQRDRRRRRSSGDFPSLHRGNRFHLKLRVRHQPPQQPAPDPAWRVHSPPLCAQQSENEVSVVIL